MAGKTNPVVASQAILGKMVELTPLLGRNDQI
jgi:hypothetical protein